MTEHDREDASTWQDLPDGAEVHQRPDGQEQGELAQGEDDEGVIPTPTPPQGRDSD